MTRHDLDRHLRQLIILGTLAVLLLPAARGRSELFGWRPLWLVGMPLAAWWSLHGFPWHWRRTLPIPRRRRAQARRYRVPHHRV
jgi:hypothetical protein